MHFAPELDPSFKSEAFETLLLDGSIFCFLPKPSMDEDDHRCREKTCFSLDNTSENRPEQNQGHIKSIQLQRPASTSETTSSESNMSETEDTGGGDEAGSKDAHRRLRAILTPEQVQAHKQTIASTPHLGRR